MLDGRRRLITVTKNEKPDRHGGIVLNDRIPDRFFYEDGSHYFNLAFECDWLFALNYGQAGIPKTRHLLSLLNRHRFNQVVMNVYYDYVIKRYQAFSNIIWDVFKKALHHTRATREVPYENKEPGFWEWRPWRGEADAVLVIRHLKPLTKSAKHIHAFRRVSFT